MLQEDAQIKKSETIYRSGCAAMAAQDYATAEAYFRACIALSPVNTVQRKLAEVLTAEGRISEAMQEYHSVVFPGGGHGGDYSDPRCLLNYAILLNRTGQWADAVYMYEKALPNLPSGTLPRYDVQFDLDDPQPVALEATAYVCLGLDSDFRCDDPTGAMRYDRAVDEFGKALALEPDWDIANYYYGYGLQQLGQTTEARAEFTKTLKIAHGGVKVAARKALAKLKRPA